MNELLSELHVFSSQFSDKKNKAQRGLVSDCPLADVCSSRSRIWTKLSDSSCSYYQQEWEDPEVPLPVLSDLTSLFCSKKALMKNRGLKASKANRWCRSQQFTSSSKAARPSAKDRELRLIKLSVGFLSVCCVFHPCYELWGVWNRAPDTSLPSGCLQALQGCQDDTQGEIASGQRR